MKTTQFFPPQHPFVPPLPGGALWPKVFTVLAVVAVLTGPGSVRGPGLARADVILHGPLDRR